MATSGSTRWLMDASTLSCMRSAMRRLGRTPSLSASSFTTTAPRIEISRVETESEIVGLMTAAVAAVVRMETDENPARLPPTRIEGGRAGCCPAAGTAPGFADAFSAGRADAFWAGFGGGCAFAGCCALGCCCIFACCWTLAALPVGCARRSLPCRYSSSASSSSSSSATSPSDKSPAGARSSSSSSEVETSIEMRDDSSFGFSSSSSALPPRRSLRSFTAVGFSAGASLTARGFARSSSPAAASARLRPASSSSACRRASAARALETWTTLACRFSTTAARRAASAVRSARRYAACSVSASSASNCVSGE